MQESIQSLVSISREDKNNLIYEKQLKTFPAKKKKIKVILNRIRKQIKENQEKIKDYDSKIKERDALIVIEKEKSQKGNDRMQAVTNQKEFAATQKEIDASNKIIKRVEDQIIEYDEKKEAINKKLEEFQADYDSEKKNIDEDLKKIIAQEDQIKEKIEVYRSLKAKLIPSVDEDLLKEYNKLFERNIIPSAVEISNTSCMGCAMSIPPQTFHDVIKNKRGKCPHCSRMLFYKAPEPVEEKKPKKKSSSKKTTKATKAAKVENSEA